MYHVYDDALNTGERESKIGRLSSIDPVSDGRPKFRVQWHPDLLEAFPVLNTSEEFSTRKEALDYETRQVQSIQSLPEAIAVFDKLLDENSCDLAFRPRQGS